MALGPCILIMVFCKIIGANIVRIILRLSGKKRSKEGKTCLLYTSTSLQLQ